MAPVYSGLYLASTSKLFCKRQTKVERVWHFFYLEIPHLELSGDFELVRINELVIINALCSLAAAHSVWIRHLLLKMTWHL